MILRSGRMEWRPLGGNSPLFWGGNCHVHVYHPPTGKARAIIGDMGYASPLNPVTEHTLLLPDIRAYLAHPNLPDHRPEILAEAICLTHGHSDHLGAIPHFLRMGYILPPIYADAFTLALLRLELVRDDIPESSWPIMHPVQSGQKIAIPNDKNPENKNPENCAFVVQFIEVAHSIPAHLLSIRTPAGHIIQSGDLNADPSGLIGHGVDWPSLTRLGTVDAMILDSTKAHLPGYKPKDEDVRAEIAGLVRQYPEKRIIVGGFGAYLQMIASMAMVAAESGRALIVDGNAALSFLLAYHAAGHSLAQEISDRLDGRPVRIYSGGSAEARALPDHETLVYTAGVGGDPGTPLAEAARDAHRWLRFSPNDHVILTGGPIPGMDTHLAGCINAINARGASITPFTSIKNRPAGHGFSEDLIAFLKIIRPHSVLPTHGISGRELKNGLALAERLGIPGLIAENGWHIGLKDGAAAILHTGTESWIGATAPGYRSTGSEKEWAYAPYNPVLKPPVYLHKTSTPSIWPL